MDLQDSRDWDSPLFSVAVAAEAAQLAPGTLRMWFVRGGVAPHQGEGGFAADADPEKEGLPRLLTFRSVLAIAAAAALAQKGIRVPDAFAAAKNWTHSGEAPFGDRPGRAPASLYDEPALTFLIHRSGEDATVTRAVRSGDSWCFKHEDLFGPNNDLSAVPTMVLLNKVEQRARSICSAIVDRQ